MPSRTCEECREREMDGRTIPVESDEQLPRYPSGCEEREDGPEQHDRSQSTVVAVFMSINEFVTEDQRVREVRSTFVFICPIASPGHLCFFAKRPCIPWFVREYGKL